jgi:ferrochelatase
MAFAGTDAILLVAHGTVERLEDLPAFLTNIRRGREPTPELVAEMRRRYEAIGGRSPLNDITTELAAKVEARTSLPTRMAMRLFHPYVRDALSAFAEQGVKRVFFVPLAQHSAPVYAQAARRDAEGLLEILSVDNWGQREELVSAFAMSIADAMAPLPPELREKTTVVMTAHSLPRSVIDAGDPYENEVRGSARRIAVQLGLDDAQYALAFQSQGLGGGEWLGPDVGTVLSQVADRGHKHVLFAPIGFLADHVEILYDLDIEAAAWAKERGLTSSRSASLNASRELVEIIAAMVQELRGAS